MRITKVSLFHKHLPMLCSSFTCSLEPGVTSADVVIVKVETDEGLVGYGEAGAVGGYPNYAAGIMSSSAELIKRHLIHQDPRDINAIQHLMSLIDGHGSIKSAFDIACWDILGKWMEQPLARLLGGRLRDSVPVYRGLPLKKPVEMGKEADAWRTEGYRMFLMKVGSGNLAEDVECIEAVMANRQPGEHYTVDASGRWRPEEALYVLKAVQHLDFVLEQPCWHYDECLSVRQRTGRAVKLDNVITDVNMVLRAQADRSCELMTLKIDKLGGVSQGRMARDITSAAGIAVTMEAQWGTEIMGAAVTQLATTTPANRLLAASDVHTYSSLTTAKGMPIFVEDGMMGMVNNDLPGLGIEVDPDSLGEAGIIINA
ncbi:mandelate racemase/muconate lactonizing enzyme family protein [Thiothrix nivea]|uniref:Mandelate racemase/muconate lactonizing protein n=1 Tax=Thiothrix nivea (strain ATCC 35100 / DSM 5205 / JP2) TaxID=870187 RepID=A0A656HN99_THINJ|nr:mandelate racemase/muconate lactonizing enzyme family protein [Thiothrix nivea]EIJ36819.1 Mandelate racemase/muconate lactonizing protein [Thiothrix nivea DSM 5205]